MPKLKTKSSAKKRFKFTATGKVNAKHAGKRHGMRKRSQKQVVNLRKSAILFEGDANHVRDFMPYAR